jgi:hypothetical protein
MSRLFVIPARDEAVAVIFRRGPSRWYHIIQWNTRRDTFTHGAWIKGRIYEEKCDISPDGQLLLCFIHQGSRCGTPYTTAWTAISRTPWLQALAVWPEGSTWAGGGRFLDNRRIVIRSNAAHRPFIPDSKRPSRRLAVTPDAPAPIHSSDGEASDADWSGRDHSDNVVFTRGDKLYRRVSGDKGDTRGRHRRSTRPDTHDVLLADFTDLTPDPQPAPDWATRPL